MLQATRVWIDSDDILKAGLFVSKKDAVNEQKEKKIEEENKKPHYAKTCYN